MVVINVIKILMLELWIVVVSARAGASVPGVRSHCDMEGKWDCDNGELISALELCDGQRHCADGSDETAENCIHLPCPVYAFHCAYGACITGTYRCDGRRDCVDNSDETEFQCSKLDLWDIKTRLQGNCSSPTMMQCKSGDCIDIEQRCDGTQHCRDGSDETVELCGHLYCPSYAFRCGYGGCIAGIAKCNGKYDCADGSDEVAQLCGRPRDRHKDVRLTTPATVVTTTHTATVATTTATAETQERSCELPHEREKLVAYDELNAQVLKLGSRVRALSVLTFACRNGWQLEGDAHNLCLGNNKWLYELPRCSKFCPYATLLLGVSTVANCTYKGKSVSCNRQLHAGTKAHISCAPGYQLPKSYPVQPVLTCDDDLEWDYPKFKCEPVCGVLPTSGGNRSGAKPWDVSIHKRTFEPRFKRQCSGTIVSPKIVLSAAACFADPIDGTDAVYYNVVEGQQTRDYVQGAPTVGRVHNISQILLSGPSNAVINADSMELAILVLINYFSLSQTLRPICLEFQISPSEELRTYTTAPSSFLSDPAKIGAATELQNSRDGASLLFGIVSHIYSNGTAALLNVNYFKNFINMQIKSYYYEL